MEKAGKFQSGAFAGNAQINFYSCNSATPEDPIKQNVGSKAELIAAAISKPSLVSTVSAVTGATTTGYVGTTFYGPVGNGRLPVGGKSGGGNNSPRINGNKVPSVKLTFKNGVYVGG